MIDLWPGAAPGAPKPPPKEEIVFRSNPFNLIDRAPHHDHTGTEYTLVVCGAFEDGTGMFGPGDLSIKRPGQMHHPVALPGGVCLALTVEEGDIALTGALGMLQRLFTRH